MEIRELTFIGLREYIDRRFASERELSNERWVGHASEHKLIALAIDKADQTMGVRLEGMNEFRAQLNKEQTTFATKDMLAPMQAFMDKFSGMAMALTICNIVLTLAISFAVHAWGP